MQMKKVLLVDLDGVIIRGRHKYFSDRFSEEYNIPLQDIMPFFKNEYGIAARGQASLREVLPKYLDQWGWKGDIDSFLNYWFEGEKELDDNVVSAIHEVRKAGVKVYIVSDNEQERADYLNKELNFSSIVDGQFYSYQIGFKKSEQEFFKTIVDSIGVKPVDVLYIDDDPANVEIASDCGVESKVFTPEFSITESFGLKMR
jgi:putative hydrolase of the HAD superfamily